MAARARGRARLAQQRVHGHAGESRVAHVAQHVGIGELLRLDHHVHGVRAVQPVLAQRVALHQVEHHQRGHALRVGPDFVHLPTPVGGLHGRHPFRLVLAQIGRGERAALLLRNGEDGLGRRSAVVPVAPQLRDSSQRSREIGILEHLTRPRRALAVNQVRLSRVRVLRVHPRRSRPAGGNHLRHGEPLLRVVDRRGQRFGERLGAEARAHGVPAGHDPRYRDGVDAALRHLRNPLRGQQLGRERRRRPSARVQPMDRARLRFVVEDEEVAADAVASGLHQADRGVGTDGGVDGVAATLENLHASSGGQRLTGRHDPHRRRDDGSADRGRRRRRAARGCLPVQPLRRQTRCRHDHRQRRRSGSHGRLLIARDSTPACPLPIANCQSGHSLSNLAIEALPHSGLAHPHDCKIAPIAPAGIIPNATITNFPNRFE